MASQLRAISLFNKELNVQFSNNSIKTTKYNLFTFLPLALLYQFKNYSNIYFLLVAIILAIKEISPQEPTVAIIPFICVIVIGLLVEAFDEFKKWSNDKKFNNSLSIVFNADSKEESSIKWADLKVGDIIHINKNEIIPADVLILKTSTLNNFCYMQTTNLDGESALKPRETLPLFHGLFTTSPLELSSLKDCSIEIESPSCNIYQCNGSVSLSHNVNKAFFQIENILLRGTILKNVDYVYGIIIYTGKDTKIMMNIQPSSIKSSSIEDMINLLLIGVIVFVFVLCIICSAIGMTFLNRNVPNYTQHLFRADYLYYSKDGNYPYTLEFFKLFGAYFILFNNIIPISLAITFTIAKVIQIFIIEFDPKLQLEPSDKLKVLSNRLQEDFGKVKYIFSDKTGTLTRNEMVFKGCSVFGILYCDEAEKDNHANYKRKDILNLNKNQPFLIKRTLESKLTDSLFNDHPIQAMPPTAIDAPPQERFSSSKEALTEFYLNIALNHNVLSEYDESKQQLSYQGPNPDEVALVSMAKTIGIEFIERIGNTITLKINKDVKDYEVLQVFAYSSERKRSGIIVKEIFTTDIKLFVKGADDKVFSMINAFSLLHLLEKSKEHLDLFAKNGLRTLCYAGKSISPKEYEIWASEFSKVKTASLVDKSKLPSVEEKIAEIESDLFLIGVSGLEDRLQDQAKEDIGKFIEAGIQVWMITGDQLDTAESIGYSSNLFEDDTEVFKIRSTATKEEIHSSLTKAAEVIAHKESQISKYKIELKQSQSNNESNGYKNSEGIPFRVNQIGFDTEGTPNGQIINYKNPLGKKRSLNDMSVIKYLFDQHLIGDSSREKQEEDTFIQCISSKGNLKHFQDKQKERLITTPDDLYLYYKAELDKINKRKQSIDNLMMITNLKFNCKSNKAKAQSSTFNPLNYGLVIEGNALIHCLSQDMKQLFWSLINKSRSVICCRCTPIQKSNIVQFVKEQSGQICLAIGDGGNDVNMIKKANIGIGVFGKEGHQAAYNSDYAIGQFKYLKQLLFYHGRYILLRNTYFIYFFFYKGILFCFPNFIFGFYTGFSGTNFYDFVWFTFYTGLISTAPPVVYMVFEEDIDVDFKANPDLNRLLPDIYREFRDSSSFNVGKYFIVFALGMIHSAVLFIWAIYAFDKGIVDVDGRAYSYWSPSNMVMLVVLIVQFVILFIDTLKWSLWVFLCHLLQIVVNILFGIFYGLGNEDELSAYTFDSLGNLQFWLILICGTLLCLIPVYFSRFVDSLFADTIINNIRNGRADKDFLKKQYNEKLQKMNKCTRSLEKFKSIYADINNFKAENFADRKMRETVLMYLNSKAMPKPSPSNPNNSQANECIPTYPSIQATKQIGIDSIAKSAHCLLPASSKESSNLNFHCGKVESDSDVISELI